MRRRAAIVSVHQLKEINMVPMIDVMMFLLVVFIITMPMLEQGIPVNLPRGKARDLSDKKGHRAVTVTAQGQLFLDNAPITRDALASEMRLQGRSDPELTVLVRADDALAYGRVVEVMKILHDANISRLGLVTSPQEKRGQ